jgi:hypothetical protein
MTFVNLPVYAANLMLATDTHLSSLKPKGTLEQSVRRTYRLIADALEGLENAQWRINDEPRFQSAILDEFYGLERFEHGYCVYGSERGIPRMLAIFADDHLAAQYFVWIVSRGTRVIDGSKFLDMEP